MVQRGPAEIQTLTREPEWPQ